MTDKLENTEAGGESTQYESVKTVTEPTPKQQGQMGAASPILEKATSTSAERGEKTAENIRYGQGISERGFGGKTTTSEGTANQGGSGAQAQDEDLKNTRREQKYGPGNDVGA